MHLLEVDCIMKRIILLAFLLLQACGSDEGDVLKQPASLNFKMDVVREATKGGKLAFDKGFLILSEFTFDGDRVQGGDTYFEKEYEDGLMVPFEPGQAIPQLNFTIPQGSYSEIEIEFEVEADDDISLQVSGQYENSSGSTYPIVLQVDNFEIFAVNARNSQGGNEIILVSGKNNFGAITLNPVHWFANVDIKDLDQAELTLFEGIETILINDDFNDDIYDDVEDRLDELMELIIL